MIQGVVLFQLLGLTLWSVYVGLCRNHDVVCQRVWGLLCPKQALENPLDKSSTASNKKSTAQVIVSALSSHLEGFEVNPDAGTVCDNPYSHVMAEHALWLCKIDQQQSHAVLHNQSIVFYYSSQEDDLENILLPTFKPRKPLSIHLIVEETASQNDTVQRTKQWTQALEEWISKSRLHDWPCVHDLNIALKVVPPLTMQWLVYPQQQKLRDDSEGTDEVADSTTTQQEENSAPLLPQLSSFHISSLLDASLSSKTKGADNLELVVYIADVLPTKESSWIADSQELFIMPATTALGALELKAVNQWLGSYMGLPLQRIEMESDGSFPKWYSNHFWEAASQNLTRQVSQDFDRARHLLVPKDSRSIHLDDPTEMYQELFRLHQRILLRERIAVLESEFPIEHYAAIFAPLLFPLIIPFIASLIKELKRYKEKEKKK